MSLIDSFFRSVTVTILTTLSPFANLMISDGHCFTRCCGIVVSHAVSVESRTTYRSNDDEGSFDGDSIRRDGKNNAFLLRADQSYDDGGLAVSN